MTASTVAQGGMLAQNRVLYSVVQGFIRYNLSYTGVSTWAAMGFVSNSHQLYKVISVHLPHCVLPLNSATQCSIDQLHKAPMSDLSLGLEASSARTLWGLKKTW